MDDSQRMAVMQMNNRTAFLDWAREHLGRGYSLETENGTFIDPVTRWAEIGFCAGMQRTVKKDSVAVDTP